jgi:hypothetical protein
VIRPALLRPAFSALCSRSFFSGWLLVIDAKSCVDIPRRPGEVGLYLVMAMTQTPSKKAMASPALSVT